MNDENENSDAESAHPTIIETEEREIPERKPPNDKIVEYHVVDEKEEEEESNSEE